MFRRRRIRPLPSPLHARTRPRPSRRVLGRCPAEQEHASTGAKMARTPGDCPADSDRIDADSTGALCGRLGSAAVEATQNWRSDERGCGQAQPATDTTSLGTGMGTSPDGLLAMHA